MEVALAVREQSAAAAETRTAAFGARCPGSGSAIRINAFTAASSAALLSPACDSRVKAASPPRQ